MENKAPPVLEDVLDAAQDVSLVEVGWFQGASDVPFKACALRSPAISWRFNFFWCLKSKGDGSCAWVQVFPTPDVEAEHALDVQAYRQASLQTHPRMIKDAGSYWF